MKVLWLVNIVLPKVGWQLGISSSVFGGWILGALNGIKNVVDITVATVSTEIDTVKECNIDNVNYIVFPYLEKELLEKEFKNYLETNNFDIVHIYGTEMYQSNSMINVFPKERTVINIQGLLYYYSIHFIEGIPEKFLCDDLLYKMLPARVIKLMKPIVFDLNDMKEKSKIELDTILKCSNMIGRTSWDKACVKQINPNINYYCVNETLRDSFYTNKVWNPNNCEKYSIFLSQANYPIKGLHYFLRALVIIKKFYPNVKVYISGHNIINNEKNILQQTKDKYRKGYDNYIKKYMYENNLSENIEFIGILSEKEMVNRYLNSNVFVCPSTIENSPNSICEAMMLGTPIVASYVGGISDLIDNNVEGMLYQTSAPYMMADCIMKIFRDDEFALKLSRNAIKRSHETHNKKRNADNLLRVYMDIIENSNRNI